MADLEIIQRECLMVVYVKGDIDHHSVEKLRTIIDTEIMITSPKRTILDFSQVQFMDSSGIGFILGRHRLATSLSLELSVQNINDSLVKILKLAGIASIVSNKTEVTK